MSKYRRALALLDRSVNVEQTVYGSARYTLTRMRAFDRACGAPHRRLKIVHITGTKGKGSTAHFIEALLRAAGFRTGLYTSPHVLDVRERIRIDGRPISRDRFAHLVRRLAPAIRRYRPSYFEILTEAAFHAFADCDWVVLEVGLGGRLDATNVVRPRACVITPISFDHTDRLGTTIEEITRDKEGIIKSGVPVVRTPARGVPPLAMMGAHQRVNAGLAIATMKALNLPVHADALRGVRLPARAQWIPGRPPFIVDAAHNVASARALADVLRRFRGRPRTLVFGAPADKDVEGMLAALLPEVDRLVVTRYRGARAMAVPAVVSVAERQGAKSIYHFPGAPAALQFVLSHSRRHEVAASAGSFYLAGEIIAGLRRNGRTHATVV
jgi:dihydrofolate synthase/folylpolyglutamate synthase